MRRRHALASDAVPLCICYPSPPARAIRNNPAPMATTPTTCAARSLAGTRRSAVMAAATTAMARRSMTPMTRRIAIRPKQQRPQWRPRLRPCRHAVPASAGNKRPRPGACRQPSKVMGFPGGELQRAGGQDGHTGRDRNGARQRRQLHLDRRQCCTQRKSGQSEHSPHKEVPPSYQCGQPTETRLGCPAHRLAVAPQHRHQGWQHHRHHHHNPHAEE